MPAGIEREVDDQLPLLAAGLEHAVVRNLDDVLEHHLYAPARAPPQEFVLHE
ncbi:hypothetical protein [Thiohalocapsa halophila]|jgi:hypothetical protein